MSKKDSDTQVEEAPVEFKSEMHRMAFQELSNFINKRNVAVGTVNAANGDRLTLKEQLTEEGTDPQIVAAREARDEAIVRLESLVTPKVDEIIDSASEGLESLLAEIKEIDSVLKPGLSYFKKLYDEDSFEALPKQARPKGVRVGGGGGGKRVRGFSLIVTIEDEVNEFENVASAAKWLNVETTKLQEAFFNAAGNPDKVKDAPDNVHFDLPFTETDEDGESTERVAQVEAYRPEAEVAE